MQEVANCGGALAHPEQDFQTLSHRKASSMCTNLQLLIKPLVYNTVGYRPSAGLPDTWSNSLETIKQSLCLASPRLSFVFPNLTVSVSQVCSETQKKQPLTYCFQ